MKSLWAPWRVEYIEAEKDVSCIFCAMPKKSDRKKALVLFSGSFSSVIMNRYPYNNGHLLISPQRHVAKIEELNVEESLDALRLLRHSIGVLTKVMKPSGFNVGINLGQAGGAGIVDHLHMHVVPRWEGDTNFMPAIAEVKVVPAHIEETYDKLKTFFERI